MRQFLPALMCCYQVLHLSCKLNMFYIDGSLYTHPHLLQRDSCLTNNSIQFVKCSLKTFIVYSILYLNNSSNCFQFTQLNSILLKCLMENLHKIFPISSSSSIKEIIDPIYSKLSCQETRWKEKKGGSQDLLIHSNLFITSLAVRITPLVQLLRLDVPDVPVV